MCVGPPGMEYCYNPDQVPVENMSKQRPGVLRLPGGTWHGIPCIQEGGHLKCFCSHISQLTYDFDELFA